MVLLVGLMCALGASAQSALIATLMHGDEISTFQSSEALKQAYEKAVDGDVITLSSGTFNAPSTIAKAITIRGAGMMVYDGAKTTPTNISGICTVKDIKSGLELNIESVRFLSQIYVRNAPGLVNFSKIFTNEMSIGGSNVDYFNVRMIHCIIAYANGNSGLSFSSSASTSMVSLVNSEVLIHFSTVNAVGSFCYDNCYLKTNFSSSNPVLYNHHLRNCIIFDDENTILSKSSTATGCVYVGEATDFFANCAPELNKSLPEGTPIFKEGTLTYELTEENQKNWIGTDGTQVGMHGGNLPFDPAVDAPVISKFNVASKTTADGKLSVDIEVKAAE